MDGRIIDAHRRQLAHAGQVQARQVGPLAVALVAALEIAPVVFGYLRRGAGHHDVLRADLALADVGQRGVDGGLHGGAAAVAAVEDDLERVEGLVPPPARPVVLERRLVRRRVRAVHRAELGDALEGVRVELRRVLAAEGELLEVGAALERALADELQAGGEGHPLEVLAAGERFRFDGEHVRGNLREVQFLAAGERGLFDELDAVGEPAQDQAGAALERGFADISDALDQRTEGQASATLERAGTDGRDALGQVFEAQAGAAGERVVADGTHGIREPHVSEPAERGATPVDPRHRAQLVHLEQIQTGQAGPSAAILVAVLERRPVVAGYRRRVAGHHDVLRAAPVLALERFVDGVLHGGAVVEFDLELVEGRVRPTARPVGAELRLVRIRVRAVHRAADGDVLEGVRAQLRRSVAPKQELLEVGAALEGALADGLQAGGEGHPLEVLATGERALADGGHLRGNLR